MQRMSQHIHLHHPQQPQYVHYSGPPGVSTASSSSSLIPPSSTPHGHTYTLGTISGPGAEIMGGGGTVNGMSSSSLNGAMVMHYQPPGMDHQSAYQQHPHQHPEQVQQVEAVASGSGSGSANVAPGASSGGIVASGDWTKDLVQLAKQAELKKHALTLQLHTAHILSAHATLDAKSRAIQDVREQKNKLDSERARLLKCLQDVNADRDRADLTEATLSYECTALRSKITQLSEGEYAIAKGDVDRLRADLGEEALPSLERVLEERSAQYLNDRRLNGQNDDDPSTGFKRSAPDGQGGPEMKRSRGRPKGSKNKKSVGA
ncbi:hypothetical protein BKA70DRAFT_1319034 [Coprinopsis sp. MPI-PUGE-AT-0042]|nr:hypothetical protein BKA70DRAFT_1319034 [Coprinopsis sp. MPI-PUGE-AT-0042]